MEQNVGGFRLRTYAGQQFAESDTVPAIVKAAPASDTVEVAGALDFGQRIEFLPVQSQGMLNQAGDAQVPGVGIKSRDGAIMQDGPFERERLAGGQQALALLQFFELSAVIAFEQHKSSRQSSVVS